MTCCSKDLHIITDVGKVVQSIGCRAVVNHFPTDQQGQSVKQSVNGVSWLVDGHNDGSPVTGHSDKICWKGKRGNQYTQKTKTDTEK